MTQLSQASGVLPFEVRIPVHPMECLCPRNEMGNLLRLSKATLVQVAAADSCATAAFRAERRSFVCGPELSTPLTNRSASA